MWDGLVGEDARDDPHALVCGEGRVDIPLVPVARVNWDEAAATLRIEALCTRFVCGHPTVQLVGCERL